MNIAICYLLFSSLGMGEITPPFPDYVYNSSERHISLKGVVKEKYLTIFGIRIHISRGLDVMRKFGSADNYRKEGERHMKYICYKSSDIKDNTVVEFGAHFAGDKFAKETISEITVGTVKDEKTKLCTATNKISILTAHDSDIRLGMEKDKFKKILGVPSYEDEENIDYYYGGKRKFTKEEIIEVSKNMGVGKNPYWDINSFICGHFVASKLAWYSVTYFETN